MSGEVRVTLRTIKASKKPVLGQYMFMEDAAAPSGEVVRVERRCEACDGTGGEETGPHHGDPCVRCGGEGWVVEDTG